MINATNTRTITDLRFKTKEILAKAKEGPVYLFHRNIPTSVIMSFEEYTNLVDQLEDSFLSLKAEELLSEPKNPKEWLSLEEVEKSLK
jgi:PHD/YefM family antitoxin component YafN of YafNO toxin-antitoxin module